jgi:hypothetical protein
VLGVPFGEDVFVALGFTGADDVVGAATCSPVLRAEGESDAGPLSWSSSAEMPAPTRKDTTATTTDARRPLTAGTYQPGVRRLGCGLTGGSARGGGGCA